MTSCSPRTPSEPDGPGLGNGFQSDRNTMPKSKPCCHWQAPPSPTPRHHPGLPGTLLTPQTQRTPGASDVPRTSWAERVGSLLHLGNNTHVVGSKVESSFGKALSHARGFRLGQGVCSPDIPEESRGPPPPSPSKVPSALTFPGLLQKPKRGLYPLLPRQPFSISGPASQLPCSLSLMPLCPAKALPQGSQRKT